jgi:geranylgeranyl pyrophosphate synthase
METNPGRGFGLYRAQLIDLYPRLGDLLARAETAFGRAWEDQPGFLDQAAREVLSGRGKRLRPALLLLAADCAGGATESSIAMASIVEIVHVASLIHDDVIDDAPSRHGRRSAKDQWGNKVSVLLGDYLIAGAFSILPRDDGNRLIAGISRVAATMCSGQIGELRAAGKRMTEEEYLGIVLAKTGSLFSYCCEVGVQTAGGNGALQDALARFGESFGIAFQLADDILDLVGTNGQSGKSEGRDVAERKWTLPLIHAYNRGDERVRQRLSQMLMTTGPTPDDIAAAREMARSTGAIDYSWSQADEWLARARQHLATVPDSPAKQALLALAGDRFPMPVMT